MMLSPPLPSALSEEAVAGLTAALDANPASWPPLAIGLLCTALLTPLLILLARRAGWVDRIDARDPDLARRKSVRAAVPLVGGTAILGALIVGAWTCGAQLPWNALVCAWTVGLVDDLRRDGLRPLVKLIGQAQAAVLFAYDPVFGAGCTPLEHLGLGLLALAAQNIVNTYDNADGVAVGHCALWASSQPLVAGALLGFLPFNLLLRKKAGLGRPPLAYLGDSGSHVLGILMVSSPAARWALLIPGLDLLRLSLVRLRLGRAPWQGDRRHLAHRLERLGRGPVRTALMMWALGVPAWVLGPWGSLSLWSAPDPAWIVLAAAPTLVACWLSPDPDRLTPDAQ